MDSGCEVKDRSRPGLEDRCANQRMRRKVLLVHHEGCNTSGTNNQGNKCPPGIPSILNATPCDWNKEARRGCEKEDHANPIHFPQLGEEIAISLVELKENGDEDKPESKEW